MARVPSLLQRENRRRRLLYQLVAGRSDIGARQVTTYAREHITDIRDELRLPLQDALVVTYARPFTSNRPIGPLPEEWTRFVDPDHQRLHGELMSMRNKLVAHGDAERRKVVIYPPGAQPPVPRGPTSEAHARLRAAAQDLLQELFGNIDATVPFDLMTGEQVPARPWDGVVISEGPAPKL